MPSTEHTLKKHHYYTHICELGHNVRYIYFRGSQSKQCENHCLLSYFTLGFFRHLQSKGCDWYRNSLQEWGVWNDRHQSMEVAESQKVVPGVGHMKRQTPEGGSAEPRWATWAAPAGLRETFSTCSGQTEALGPDNHVNLSITEKAILTLKLVWGKVGHHQIQWETAPREGRKRKLGEAWSPAPPQHAPLCTLLAKQDTSFPL